MLPANGVAKIKKQNQPTTPNLPPPLFSSELLEGGSVSTVSERSRDFGNTASFHSLENKVKTLKARAGISAPLSMAPQQPRAAMQSGEKSPVLSLWGIHWRAAAYQITPLVFSISSQAKRI